MGERNSGKEERKTIRKLRIQNKSELYNLQEKIKEITDQFYQLKQEKKI